MGPFSLIWQLREVNVGKILYSLILAFLMLSFPIIISKTNAQTTAIFVDPASIQNEALTVGTTFTVNLNVADVTNLFTWQILMQFNSTVLSCENATYPTAGYIFGGLNQIPVSPIIDNTAGTVNFGATLLTQVASGSGIMCTIAFKVLAVGHSALAFSTPYGADTFLLDDALNVMTASVTNGFFSNEGAPPPERHDIAITGLSFSNNSPKQNETIVITVIVKNNGTAAENALSVKVSNGTTLIETQTVTSLAAGETKSLNYSWDTAGAPLGQNSITANATAVPGETDLGNNVKTGTVTVLSWTAKSVDINGDGIIVDMHDIAMVAWSFGTGPGDARWYDNRDLTGPQGVSDGIINEFDIAAVVKHWWKKP